MHALHVTVVALVAARVLNEPAVLVALGSPGQVLGSTFLRIVQVPVSHPSHVGIAMQSSQSILSPLLVSPRRYVLKIHFFIEFGLKMIQFKIQFKTKSKIFIQKNIHSKQNPKYSFKKIFIQ